MTRRSLAFAGASLVGAALALTACTPASPGTDQVTVDVYAAASLTDVFTDLARAFENTHPHVRIELTFAGSAELATHITEGAPADVFASASEQVMTQVRADQVGGSQTFATNTLTIAVPAGNPAGITGLQSLARPDVLLVTCAPSVPCGAAATRIQHAHGITLQPASEESNVSDVLGKVATGEADAGLVYVTDIARAQGVEAVALEGASAAVSVYPITALSTGDAADAGTDFISYVLSDEGRPVLADAGFGLP